MGAECPHGHGRQKIVQNITADGTPPHKSRDIIARKLACGCVLESGQFEEFQEAVSTVNEWKGRQLAGIEKEATRRMGQAYKEFVMAEDDEHAE